MNLLTLGELEGKTLTEIRQYIADSFQVPPVIVAPYEILIAFEWSGGYEETNWFLLRKGRRLFENHGKPLFREQAQAMHSKMLERVKTQANSLRTFEMD